jgi:hypothetical protein
VLSPPGVCSNDGEIRCYADWILCADPCIDTAPAKYTIRGPNSDSYRKIWRAATVTNGKYGPTGGNRFRARKDHFQGHRKKPINGATGGHRRYSIAICRRGDKPAAIRAFCCLAVCNPWGGNLASPLVSSSSFGRFERACCVLRRHHSTVDGEHHRRPVAALQRSGLNTRACRYQPERIPKMFSYSPHGA